MKYLSMSTPPAACVAQTHSLQHHPLKPPDVLMFPRVLECEVFRAWRRAERDLPHTWLVVLDREPPDRELWRAGGLSAIEDKLQLRIPSQHHLVLPSSVVEETEDLMAAAARKDPCVSAQSSHSATEAPTTAHHKEPTNANLNSPPSLLFWLLRIFPRFCCCSGYDLTSPSVLERAVCFFQWCWKQWAVERQWSFFQNHLRISLLRLHPIYGTFGRSDGLPASYVRCSHVSSTQPAQT